MFHEDVLQMYYSIYQIINQKLSYAMHLDNFKGDLLNFAPSDSRFSRLIESLSNQLSDDV